MRLRKHKCAMSHSRRNKNGAIFCNQADWSDSEETLGSYESEHQEVDSSWSPKKQAASAKNQNSKPSMSLPSLRVTKQKFIVMIHKLGLKHASFFYKNKKIIDYTIQCLDYIQPDQMNVIFQLKCTVNNKQGEHLSLTFGMNPD